MNGGVMQYSLGLATGGFLSNLGKVGTAIQGFIGSIASVGAISEGVFGQIEHGAWLEGLSRRTEEGVGSLYKLEKGFKAVRIPAENLPQVILQMQKAIGGFNEMGEPTKNIFKGLGLSIGELKSHDVAKQVEEITSAMGKLSKEEAAAASGKIFGRMGAGDMLQLARSGKDFGDALDHAQQQGALFARNAKAFNQIEISLMNFRGRVNSLFAGIAEGAAPGIQRILDMLTKVDLSGVGRTIGKMITLLESSFREGNLTEVIAEALGAGFEKAVNFLARSLQAVMAAIPEIMQAEMAGASSWGSLLKSSMHGWLGAFEQMQAEQGSNPKMKAAAAANAKEHYRLADSSLSEAKEKVGEAFRHGMEAVAAALKADTSNPLGTEMQDKLAKRLAGVPDNAAAAMKQGTGTLDPDGEKHIARGRHASEDQLTRIGFYSHASSGGDEVMRAYTRRTAVAVEGLKELYEKYLTNPALRYQPDELTWNL